MSLSNSYLLLKSFVTLIKWMFITMIYGDYDTRRQNSFCFYKVNPSSGNLKWINNGYKLNSQGYGKSKTATWLFPAPWQSYFLFERLKPFLAIGLISHNKKKRLKCVCYNLQRSGHPLCPTGHTDTGKKLHKLLGDYRFTFTGKDRKTKGSIAWDWTDY